MQVVIRFIVEVRQPVGASRRGIDQTALGEVGRYRGESNCSLFGTRPSGALTARSAKHAAA